MSKESELIKTAMDQTNAQLAALQSLSVDQAKLDSASEIQASHASDAAAQAEADAQSVATGKNAVTSDLATVATARKNASDALDALAALAATPTTPPPQIQP